MKRLRNSKRKGFTLIELIVVIVIIAILVAALTPAILGVIERANVAADQADARSVMMAASVAALKLVPPAMPLPAQVTAELTGASNVHPGSYEVFFEGPVGVGCTLTGGRSSTPQSIGVITSTSSITVVVP